MTPTVFNGKEVVRSSEFKVLSAPEMFSSHGREQVIYDRSAFQLEELRREIANVKPVQYDAPAPVFVDTHKPAGKSRWNNLFNSRKEKMLN